VIYTIVSGADTAELLSEPEVISMAMVNSWKKNPNVLSVESKAINLAAIDSNTISVHIPLSSHFTFKRSEEDGRPETWTGRSGSYAATLRRDGQHLDGDIEGDIYSYKVSRGSNGPGLLMRMKPSGQRHYRVQSRGRHP
jgi:hypothetical protein